MEISRDIYLQIELLLLLNNYQKCQQMPSKASMIQKRLADAADNATLAIDKTAKYNAFYLFRITAELLARRAADRQDIRRISRWPLLFEAPFIFDADDDNAEHIFDI